MTRSAADVRQDFIDFFTERGHTFVPGSPVVPYDDPTLLFTNAGMNQFKDVFLATGTRNYTRAANSQPCIRAGGKHNDLDDVGQDTYHHTFFEMLGNWSFGDYFKKEAIEWAWELLTKVWGLDKTRLHATYFEGNPAEGLAPDDEAKALWAAVTDIDPTHIHPGSKKDNFWEMGETGPCGPCSEIHIDLTPDKSGAALVNAGDARAIEIWNLVFIQFNRDAAGKLTPLPAKHVDTGMGFERVTALLQGKSSNYDTDVFTPIFEAIRDITGAPPYRGTLPGQDSRIQGFEDPSRGGGATPSDPRILESSDPQAMIDISYRVIADHARCLTFAINDGCVPDREGRGYVLRRILRRAVRYGWQYFNMHEPFLYKLVPTVVATLGDAFPQLRQKPEQIAEIIREEEESFCRTLDRGIALFDEAAEFARKRHHGEIRGEDAFKLHDTYGFPIDLTQIMAEEQGLRVDFAEYERLMGDARERARGTVGEADGRYSLFEIVQSGNVPFTRFVGYERAELKLESFLRVFLERDGTYYPEEAGAGQRVAVAVSQTPFYAEAGGQVGDHGLISTPASRIRVQDTIRVGDVTFHLGTVEAGAVHDEDSTLVRLRVDSMFRGPAMQNHTATHVMNWALRGVLGDHVQQKGSLVDPDKTRFDFSHPKALTPEEIERVESLVNDKIAQNLTVYDEPVEQETALKIHGLRAVFGEKYPDIVRVMAIGTPVKDLVKNPDNPEWRNVSIEFCGGTHCANTGQIGQFAIVSEEAVAKGIRRVVGVTAEAAKTAIQLGTELLERADDLRNAGAARAEARGSSVDAAPDLASQVAGLQQTIADATLRVVDRAKLRDATSELQKIIKKQQKREAAAVQHVVTDRINQLLEEAPKVGDTTIVVADMPDVPFDQLKTGADMVKQKCGSAAVLFGIWVDRPSAPEAQARAPSEPEAQARAQGKALLLAAMSNDLVKRGIKAGDLIKQVAPLVDGRGGGPPTMAQAGGKDPEKIPDALAAGRKWIEGKLGQ